MTGGASPEQQRGRKGEEQAASRPEADGENHRLWIRVLAVLFLIAVPLMGVGALLHLSAGIAVDPWPLLLAFSLVALVLSLSTGQVLLALTVSTLLLWCHGAGLAALSLGVGPEALSVASAEAAGLWGYGAAVGGLYAGAVAAALKGPRSTPHPAYSAFVTLGPVLSLAAGAPLMMVGLSAILEQTSFATWMFYTGSMAGLLVGGPLAILVVRLGPVRSTGAMEVTRRGVARAAQALPFRAAPSKGARRQAFWVTAAFAIGLLGVVIQGLGVSPPGLSLALSACTVGLAGLLMAWVCGSWRFGAAIFLAFAVCLAGMNGASALWSGAAGAQGPASALLGATAALLLGGAAFLTVRRGEATTPATKGALQPTKGQGPRRVLVSPVFVGWAAGLTPGLAFAAYGAVTGSGMSPQGAPGVVFLAFYLAASFAALGLAPALVRLLALTVPPVQSIALRDGRAAPPHRPERQTDLAVRSLKRSATR